MHPAHILRLESPVTVPGTPWLESIVRACASDRVPGTGLSPIPFV
jgi:hypothetical protein